MVGGGLLKEALIISGLVGNQVVFAIYTIFLSRILALGIDPLLLVIMGNLVQAVLILPFAVVLERKKWPERLSPGLVGRFMLLAFGGVTAFQGLMSVGIKNTSPAIASAMPNLAPGLIFIIAVCFRFEKFEIRCNYTRFKIMGTLVCLTGVIAMSFFQSPPSTEAVTHLGNLATYKDWSIGCICLLLSVISLSCYVVFQAATMVKFPAPFSLCVITSLIGAAFTALLQFIIQGNFDISSPDISFTSVILFVLMGSLVTGICISFQTWCLKKKGPVMVSIFSPIQTICSALLSSIFLRQFISLASFAGMIVMFTGLYIVLWAKRKESSGLVDVGENATLQKHDIEKPLLS